MVFWAQKNKENLRRIKEKHVLLREHRVCNTHGFLGSKSKENLREIKEKHTLLSEHKVCNDYVFRGGLSRHKTQRKPKKNQRRTHASE